MPLKKFFLVDITSHTKHICYANKNLNHYRAKTEMVHTRLGTRCQKMRQRKKKKKQNSSHKKVEINFILQLPYRTGDGEDVSW